MKIEMDAGVKVYVLRVIAEMVGPEFANESAIFQESAVMCVLEGMVASGVIEHKYDVTRNLDSFLSTDRLIRNWGWAFPGDTFSHSCVEREIVTIDGKRTRYINDRWLIPDPENPFPSWPD